MCAGNRIYLSSSKIGPVRQPDRPPMPYLMKGSTKFLYPGNGCKHTHTHTPWPMYKVPRIVGRVHPEIRLRSPFEVFDFMCTYCCIDHWRPQGCLSSTHQIVNASGMHRRPFAHSIRARSFKTGHTSPTYLERVAAPMTVSPIVVLTGPITMFCGSRLKCDRATGQLFCLGICFRGI